MPPAFEDYIVQAMSAVEYRDVLPQHGARDDIPGTIDRHQALEDIDMLRYLLSTSYAGYEYWQERGVDFEAYFKGLGEFARARETVAVADFEAEVAGILDQILDGHISFVGYGYHMAYRHRSVQYADIVVERTSEGRLRVLQSLQDQVAAGDFLTEREPERYLFRTLSPPGTFHYLLGVLATRHASSAMLSFNGLRRSLALRPSRLLLARFDDESPYALTRADGIPVLRVTGFSDAHYEPMRDFMEAGTRLRQEPTVVVNLMNNGGGSSVFPQTFLTNLNGRVSWETHWGELTSPPITRFYATYPVDSEALSPSYRGLIDHFADQEPAYRRDPRKRWDFHSTAAEPGGTFAGKLVLLTNRRVLSAGENLVGAASGIAGRVVIGENTGGVAQFSSACSDYLPHSRLALNLPRQLILVPGLEEGVGYMPDYWLDTERPLESVLSWLRAPDEYAFRYDQSYEELQATLAPQATIPDDITVVPPAADIPEALAAFSGRWFGRADGVLDHELVVERIHGINRIDAIYAWGIAPQWGIQTPGWRRYRGTFEDGQLVLEDESQGIRITYTAGADGTLHSVYQRAGVYSVTELTRTASQ